MPGELREFIIKHFSRDQLLTFCADYFRDFYEDYNGVNITNSALARELIDHCQHRGLTNALHANLQKVRQVPYSARFGRIAIPEVQTHPRDPRQVFLSYSSHDLEFAQRLSADLRAEGVAVWVAFDSIQPSESWTSAIDRGLSESGIYVVTLTPNSVASPWVKAEVQFALQEQQSGEGRLLPLLVMPCDVRQLSPLLTTVQYIDFGSGYARGLASVFQVLGMQTATERERLRLDGEAKLTQRRAQEERRQRDQAEAVAVRVQQEEQRLKSATAQLVDADGSAIVPQLQTRAVSHRTFLQSVGNVVTFKAPVYKDIAHDASAMQPAAIIVIAVAVVSGLISGLLGQGGLVIGLITALLGVLLGWVIGSWLTAFVAKTIFKGETNTAEMMRVQGHTYIFNILSIIPVIGGIAAAVLSVIANVLAIREASGLDTTKSILTAVIVGVIVFVITTVIVGIFVAGSMMAGTISQ